MNKPTKLCKLEKEKLIDVQKGFVDTFNWMVDFCDQLTNGNIEVKDLSVITCAKYDTSAHKFTVKTRKMRVIVLDKKETDSTVFEAVAHTEEN